MIGLGAPGSGFGFDRAWGRGIGKMESGKRESGKAEKRKAVQITVHNRKDGARGAGVQEYIGRPRSLGNPYVIGVDGTRAEVIGKYKLWLWKQIKDGLEQEGKGQAANLAFASLRRLQRQGRTEPIRLICHCKPLPCHGEVIQAALEWLEKQHPA